MPYELVVYFPLVAPHIKTTQHNPSEFRQVCPGDGFPGVITGRLIACQLRDVASMQVELAEHRYCLARASIRTGSYAVSRDYEVEVKLPTWSK